MNVSIEPMLYFDPQAAIPAGRCPLCGAELYPPAAVCFLCGRERA